MKVGTGFVLQREQWIRIRLGREETNVSTTFEKSKYDNCNNIKEVRRTQH